MMALTETTNYGPRFSMDFPGAHQVCRRIVTNVAGSLSGATSSAIKGAASLPLPPGYSAASRAGWSQHPTVPVRSCRNVCASVDAAASALLLYTHGSTGIIEVQEPVVYNQTLHISNGEPLGLGDSASPSQWAQPSPMLDWTFSTNPHSDRVKARFAATDAADEISYEPVERPTWRAKRSDASGGNGGGGGHHGDGGSVRKLISVLTGVAGNDYKGSKRDPPSHAQLSGGASARPRMPRKRRSGGGGWRGTMAFLRGGRLGLRGDEDAPMPVLRSRDSRIVHRVRLGLDVQSPNPWGDDNLAVLSSADGGGAGSPSGDDDDNVNAKMVVAAVAFATAASAVSPTTPAATRAPRHHGRTQHFGSTVRPQGAACAAGLGCVDGAVRFTPIDGLQTDLLASTLAPAPGTTGRQASPLPAHAGMYRIKSQPQPQAQAQVGVVVKSQLPRAVGCYL